MRVQGERGQEGARRIFFFFKFLAGRAGHLPQTIAKCGERWRAAEASPSCKD